MQKEIKVVFEEPLEYGHGFAQYLPSIGKSAAETDPTLTPGCRGQRMGINPGTSSAREYGLIGFLPPHSPICRN